MPDSFKTPQQQQQQHFAYPAQLLPAMPGHARAAALPPTRSFESLPETTAGFLNVQTPTNQQQPSSLSLDAALAKVGKKDPPHPLPQDGVFPGHLLAAMALSGHHSAAHAALLSGQHPGGPSAAATAGQHPQQHHHHHHPQSQQHYLQYHNSPQRGGGQQGFFQEMRMRFSLQRPESPMRNFILEGKSSDFF